MQATQRYVNFAYLLGAVLLWATLAKLFRTVAFAVDLPDPAVIGSGFTATTAGALAIATVTGIVVSRQRRVSEFCNEVAAELAKVTWPSRKETQRSTVVVIVTTMVLAAALGAIDTVWAKLTGLIY